MATLFRANTRLASYFNYLGGFCLYILTKSIRPGLCVVLCSLVRTLSFCSLLSFSLCHASFEIWSGEVSPFLHVHKLPSVCGVSALWACMRLTFKSDGVTWFYPRCHDNPMTRVNHIARVFFQTVQYSWVSARFIYVYSLLQWLTVSWRCQKTERLLDGSLTKVSVSCHFLLQRRGNQTCSYNRRWRSGKENSATRRKL